MKVSSPMDKNGNASPTWNATLRLIAEERLVQDGNAVLVIDLYDHGTFGNKHVGSCTIPLQSLAKAIKPTEVEKDKDKADKVPADEANASEGSSSNSANFMSVPVKTRSLFPLLCSSTSVFCCFSGFTGRNQLRISVHFIMHSFPSFIVPK